jgi:molecular chaperone DnaK
LIHATEKTVKEAGDKAAADEKSAIEAALTEARDALKADDLALIEAATTKLTEASGSLAQKLYAEQQAAGAQGAGEAGGSQKAEDDGVVDAEFEEVKDK